MGIICLSSVFNTLCFFLSFLDILESSLIDLFLVTSLFLNDLRFILYPFNPFVIVFLVLLFFLSLFSYYSFSCYLYLFCSFQLNKKDRNKSFFFFFLLSSVFSWCSWKSFNSFFPCCLCRSFSFFSCYIHIIISSFVFLIELIDSFNRFYFFL